MSQPRAHTDHLRSIAKLMMKHCTPAIRHKRVELVYGDVKLWHIFAYTGSCMISYVYLGIS
jgi:hypothetical protein